MSGVRREAFAASFPPARRASSSVGRAEPLPDFARLVGPAGWARLAPAIRGRFGRLPPPGGTIAYAGVMRQVEASAAGFALAQLWRLVGTPFAPWRGRDVPTVIRLRRDADGIGWDREYAFPGRAPVLVRSRKRLDAGGALVETVTCGVGMRLAVSEEAGALHFRSRGYHWRLGRVEIPLPALLSPGDAHVVHEELGRGRFRFSMTIVHPLLGPLFRQIGEFAASNGDTP